MRIPVLCLAALAVVSIPAAHAEDISPASSKISTCADCEGKLQQVLAHPRRAADRGRDEFRHPAETLVFFRVEPGMTVVDIMPSGGWYTRVLVPYLGEKGRYIGLNPDPGDNKQFAAYAGGLAEKFPLEAAKWDLAGAPVSAYNTDGLPTDVKGTVDRVLVFRSMHTLARNGIAGPELQAMHQLLKADGLLGIEQHRAKADAPDAYMDGSKGYMRQKDVIALVEKHGFELVGTSEINANPKDTADHPAGVWELPPNLRTKREELKAVGESDRMTLLFRKRP